MPPRSALTQLPDDILTELNGKLIDTSFSDYAGLSDWLKEQGYEISKTAVHRHGSKLQLAMEKSMSRARERMALAKALGGASDEDKAALMEASEMVAADQIMDMFEEIADMEVADRVNAIPKLVRAFAELNKSAIGSAKWKREFEAELRAQAAAEKLAAANAAEPIAKAAGLADNDWAMLRAKFLGIEVAA